MNFSYRSNFHVNIITGSGVMTILFYKGLTRNLEIGNTPVWDLPNIWRLGQVWDTKFGANVSNKMLLNAGKYQVYNFYRFWVTKGKPTGGKVTHPPPPKLGLRYAFKTPVFTRNWFIFFYRFINESSKFYWMGGLRATQLWNIIPSNIKNWY